MRRQGTALISEVHLASRKSSMAQIPVVGVLHKDSASQFFLIAEKL
jgi:hypothetical protein